MEAVRQQFEKTAIDNEDNSAVNPTASKVIDPDRASKKRYHEQISSTSDEEAAITPIVGGVDLTQVQQLGSFVTLSSKQSQQIDQMILNDSQLETKRFQKSPPVSPSRLPNISFSSNELNNTVDSISAASPLEQANQEEEKSFHSRDEEEHAAADNLSKHSSQSKKPGDFAMEDPDVSSNQLPSGEENLQEIDAIEPQLISTSQGQEISQRSAQRSQHSLDKVRASLGQRFDSTEQMVQDLLPQTFSDPETIEELPQSNFTEPAREESLGDSENQVSAPVMPIRDEAGSFSQVNPEEEKKGIPEEEHSRNFYEVSIIDLDSPPNPQANMNPEESALGFESAVVVDSIQSAADGGQISQSCFEPTSSKLHSEMVLEPAPQCFTQDPNQDPHSSECQSCLPHQDQENQEQESINDSMTAQSGDDLPPEALAEGNDTFCKQEAFDNHLP